MFLAACRIDALVGDLARRTQQSRSPRRHAIRWLSHHFWKISFGSREGPGLDEKKKI